MQNNQQMLKDFLNGFWRGIRFRWHQKIKRAMNPSFITYQITNRCNARCKMCNIWKKKHPEEFTPEEVDRIFSDSILRDVRLIDITGGEPFISTNIVEIINIISSKLPHLKEVAFSTNGYLTDKILEDVSKILKKIKKDIRLCFSISIDGFENLHDQIRGVPGSYQKAVKTLNGLSNLDNKRINIGIAVTITPYNAKNLERIYQHLKGISDKVTFTLASISANYFDNKDLIDELQLSEEEKKIVGSFCENLISIEPLRAYNLKAITSLCRYGNRTIPCTAGYAMLFLSANGDVYPCNVASPEQFWMGNVHKEKLSDIWLSQRSRGVRKSLADYQLCKRCSSNCDYATLIREDFYDFLSFLLSNPIIFKKFIVDVLKKKEK